MASSSDDNLDDSHKDDASPHDKAPTRKSETNSNFLRAARAGNLDSLITHVKDGTDIDACNSNGLTALHLASKEGHVNVIDELVRRGAAVDASTKKGNTALHIASLAGQLDVVNVLLDHGAKVNIQSQNGFTALYMAAQENHVDVVRCLLLNSANQTLATEDGFTPLAVALQQGHDKVVALLLENDSGGKIHLPALHIAAKKDDTKAAALLLQNAHNIDKTSGKGDVANLANDTTKSGFTPLHIAAHYGNTNVAQLLIEKGADVNYKARNSITPLHVASKWGRSGMVSLLLDNTAVIDCQTRDGLTPLHCAARSGHDQVVDLLLDREAPVMAKTKNGLSPLHMAIQGDHSDCARLLLLRHADINDVTVDYLTPLHVAAHCGNVKTAKLLLDRKCEVNARALNGFTPLHIACKKNRIKVVELLLKYGAAIEATTESGLTPLHVAAFMGHMNILLYLIQHGAGIDTTTVRGETALHLAARANQTDVMRILLRNGAQVDARAREQQTPLHIAARLGNADNVVLLLQHGASPDSTTKDLYTALHIASKEGHEDVVAVLLDHGANHLLTTKKGFTPLHVAAKYGHLRAARLLLKRGSDPNVEGRNGLTPLHVATHYSHIAVALMLMENGATPCCVAKNGYTPLHITAKKNLMDIAPTLFEYGAQPNAESRNGFTALHLASQDGHEDMAGLLLERGADVNWIAKNGLTSLHLTAQEDAVNVATILVKNGAQIDPKTKAGYTPLHTACHFGQMNMIRFLLEHGASVDATTKMGYTPLHHAAQQGHVLVITILLKYGASPDAVSTAGQTPMSIAERLGYLSVVEILRPVTAVTVPAPLATDEKYRVISPEIMQEAPMSDSEEEGGDDTAELGDQSFQYIATQSLRDDSLVQSADNRDLFGFDRHRRNHSGSSSLGPAAIREELKYIHDDDDVIVKETLIMSESATHQYSSYNSAGSSPYIYDSTDHSYVPRQSKPSKLRWKSFLVSFMVDARGGALRGCRHGGMRVLVPPAQASMPTRITCRLVRKERLLHPPPLMEGEALASRILEMGPVGAQLLGPMIIEVPHFASLRGEEREIAVLRSDDGQSWRQHVPPSSEDAVHEMLEGHFEDYEEDLSPRTDSTRIVTQDFPLYFAVVSRVRLDVAVIGSDGGVISSKVVPQVQAVFPSSALSKSTKVALQVLPVSPELVSRYVGSNRVAVSPVVTLEPRRRKFHQPVLLTVPLPKAFQRGMINQYSTSGGTSPPNLRLLCSVFGTDTFAYLVGESPSIDHSPTKYHGVKSPVHWEDITNGTSLKLVNDCVTFTTTLSGRFWLVDCQNASEAVRMAPDLYSELVAVPFMSKFVVFAKREDVTSAKLRLFCMSDDSIEKTLEGQEHFTEVARSRDIEVLEGRPQYVEMTGNLAVVSKSGEQPYIEFNSFYENRLPLVVRVRDPHQDCTGRVAFFREPRTARSDLPQPPTCSLNIRLPSIDDSAAGDAHDAGKIRDDDETEITIETRKLNEINLEETDKNSKRDSYVDASFDPLKAEMGSLRELGSSRDSSMQRGASLDVCYDERDISKESESMNEETGSETGSVIEQKHDIVVDSNRLESGEAVAEESVVVTERDADKTPVMELLQRLSESDDLQSQQTEPLQLHGMEVEMQQQQKEVTCTSPGEQSSVVADLARSDPVVELPGHEQMEVEAREKGDDTGEELSDRSDVEEWEVMEEVREEEFVKTERIISTDEAVIPQNLPEPEHQLDTPLSCVEASLAEEELVQRVAVEEGEELREDGFTVIRRLTTMYHIRTEFLSPKFRGDEPRKVEKLLGTEFQEQITELAPGVHLPYDDDAEVETAWDESEDCLPDGTWVRKKTTRTTVYPPPSAADTPVDPAVSLSPEGTSFLPPDFEDRDQSGLVDSGYRDETSHDLFEEFVQSGLPVQQLESSPSDFEQPENSDLAAEEPTVHTMPEITHLAGKEDFEVQESPKDSSSWLSTPQIAVQIASPTKQSPASEDESTEADNELQNSAGYVDQTMSETAVHVEDQELENEDNSRRLSSLELLQDSEPITEIIRSEEDSEEVKSGVTEDQPVPGEEEEEPIEGRLSADTSEQIFIGQQIEAMAASNQQQPHEEELPAGHLSQGVDESEHIALPTESLCLSSSADIDQLQSPYKPSTDDWKPEVGLKDSYWSPSSPPADDSLVTSTESEDMREVAEARRGASTPPEVGRVEIDKVRDTSPHFMVESPPERLSPSHQHMFGDDLSPVADPPQSKRKVVINIGTSPSGFILEEEDEEEEEIDEELEVVDARMFRPIVEPQSSGELPTDYEPDEVEEHVPDVDGEGAGQLVDVDVGQASLCDGPGEVSDDDERDGTPENFEKVETSDVGEVLEAEPVAAGALECQPQDAEEFQFESAEHDVPDSDQLIVFDDVEETSVQLPSSEQDEGPAVDDEFDLPPPPPPPEQDGDDQ